MASLSLSLVSSPSTGNWADHTIQSHGAMENWGLITYRTTAVLFDEASSDVKYKNRVAYVVAHGQSMSVCDWS